MYLKFTILNIVYPANVTALMQMHYAQLPEKAKRHYCALESLKLGRGGVKYVSSILPVSRKTILAGKKELLALDTGTPLGSGRQRKPGGGRKKRTAI